MGERRGRGRGRGERREEEEEGRGKKMVAWKEGLLQLLLFTSSVHDIATEAKPLDVPHLNSHCRSKSV